MESGKIIDVAQNKKGLYHGKVRIDSGGILHIPPGHLKPDHNNKDCKFERQNGQLVRLTVGGETVFQRIKQATSPRSNQRSGQPRAGRAIGYGSVLDDAKAPYNFVPLNHKVVPCPHQELNNTSFGDAYHDDFVTGHIDCELETVTPLFIGQEQERDAQGRSTESLPFFNIDGNPMVPGSSLRGMVRTLVEIVSWGKFTGINSKRKLYFRDVADPNSSLGKLYHKLLQKGEVRSGLLKKRRRSYIIEPSHPVTGGTIFTVDEETAKSVGFEGPFKFMEVYFLPEKHDKPGFPRVRNLSKMSKPGYVKGFLVASGDFPKKKNHWIITAPKNGQEVDIPEDVVNNYRWDKSRKVEADLFDQLKRHTEVPCFYIQDHEGNVTAFGHTLYFRMPYQNSVGEHVPAKLVDSEIIDIPEALFGKETRFATRLFFEDARLSEEKNNIFTLVGLPRLESPKPTSYQLYLEQDSKFKGQLKHWDDREALLRGYKLYWHKDLKEPIQGTEQGVNIEVQALKPGVKLKFRIRFENLSPVELGAVLFVLNLPDGLLHKLGMGKPVGLGSVKIKPKLMITNRKERYSKLFDGQSWNLSEEQVELQEYIFKFEQYVLRNINSKEASLWDHSRMRALYLMLDWTNTKIGTEEWIKATEYMGVGKFKKQVLPTPEEVVNSIN